MPDVVQTVVDGDEVKPGCWFDRRCVSNEIQSDGSYALVAHHTMSEGCELRVTDADE